MVGRLFRSVAFRQAAVTVLLVLAALAVFSTAAIDAVEKQVQRDLLHTIDTDIAGLADVFTTGGVADLQRRIDDRTSLASNDQAAAYYLLRAADGRRLAGNMPAAPDADPARSATAVAPMGADHALVRATLLRGGLALYVGRSLSRQQALLAALRQRFIWAAAGVILAALLVAGWISWDLGRQVTGLNLVFERFERGDLEVRPPGTRRQDEFATLSRHVAVHLEQSARFVEVQRQISDNIAHELRTPLMHLDARLRRLLETGDAEGPVAGELEMARADIREAVTLFDLLLDIALAEGAGQGKPTRFDASEVAADLADLYSASAEEGGLAFAARIAPGVSMFGEPMQVSRMLANLLDNAFKFAPSGSRVDLIVEPGPRLVVEDNGPGVPEADRERIFQRFGRSASTAKGHGLGLALVKVIAARHGLTVRVEDAGPGARFVIEPAVPARGLP